MRGNRVGQVAVSGDYADARVTASGTGSVYVSGVTGSVAATVSGIGNLFVEAANRARLDLLPACGREQRVQLAASVR